MSRGGWLLAAAVSVAMVAACNPPSGGGGAGGIKRLSIATGGTGGVYYPYGGGIAKIISENLEGVQATAEATAASVDNLKFLRDGRSDIAFRMADTVDDAANGAGSVQGIRQRPGARRWRFSIRTTCTWSRSPARASRPSPT